MYICSSWSKPWKPIRARGRRSAAPGRDSARDLAGDKVGARDALCARQVQEPVHRPGGTVPAVGHPTGRGMGGIAVVERFAVHVDGEQYRAFCTIGPDDTCVFQRNPFLTIIGTVTRASPGAHRACVWILVLW